MPLPPTPSSKAGHTTALTSPDDVQVVTSTISDDHTLSAKASNRPMPLDQTFPLKPAVRQPTSGSSGDAPGKHLSPTSSNGGGGGDLKGKGRQKRVAFVDDQGDHAADEDDEGGRRGSISEDAPAEDEDIDFDGVFDAGREDAEDAPFELEEELEKDLPSETEGNDDDFRLPTLEETVRMLGIDDDAQSGSSAQAIGVGAAAHSASRNAQSASDLSSSIRIAGSFSQFMRGQSGNDGWQNEQRLAELTAEREIDPAEPPSPPSAKDEARPIVYEGVSQSVEPLSTSHVGSYTAWGHPPPGGDNSRNDQRARPSLSHLRRPSAGAETGLNQIIGANVPSHRAMWSKSRKSSKFELSDEDNKRWAAWQRRGSGEGSEGSRSGDSGADLSRSVPAGPALQQAIQRGGLHAPSAEGGGVNIPSRQPSAQERRDVVDREAKTSLPYNEKLLVPSYMKAVGNMSSARLGRMAAQRQLSTITDEDGPTPGSSAPRVTVGFGAGASSSSTIGSMNRAPSGSSIKREDSATRARLPLQRVPFLAPQDSERRQARLRDPYRAPPGPTSLQDRLVESEEDAPAPLPLFKVPPQPFKTGSTLPGRTVPDDFADANNQAEGVMKFMHRVEMLKKNKRTGWYHHRVEQPESIADHMYRMGMLAMLCAADDSGLDVGKCVMLALIHDLAEAEVGDLTPRDHVDKAEKTRREAEAIEYLTLDLLGGSRAGERIEALWREYEERETREARLVKDLDRFELCLQALEYEREHNIRDLQPFFRGAIGDIGHPIVRNWAQRLAKERQQMWAERGYVYEQTYGENGETSRSVGRSSGREA